MLVRNKWNPKTPSIIEKKCGGLYFVTASHTYFDNGQFLFPSDGQKLPLGVKFAPRLNF